MKKTAKCNECGSEVVLPFKCNYCGSYFCGDHRIPERHNCSEAWKARAPRNIPPIQNQSWSKPSSYQHTISYTPSTSRLFGFSRIEIRHLIIGTLLVLSVGLTYFLSINIASTSRPFMLITITVAFTLSFLLHEIAHKFTAQYYNMWAEFRLTLQGALITLVSIFLPFKIISPGAVMIMGSGNSETVGKTALSGPITNMIISTFCILFALITQELFWFIAFINAFLALFNLIPFGVFDGLKVFRWNKIYWFIAFSLSLILAFFSYNFVIGIF